MCIRDSCCVKLIEGYLLVCIDAIARHNAEVAQYHVSTCGQSGDESQDKADSEGLLQLCKRTLVALLHCLIGQVQRIRDFLYGHSVIVLDVYKRQGARSLDRRSEGAYGAELNAFCGRIFGQTGAHAGKAGLHAEADVHESL